MKVGGNTRILASAYGLCYTFNMMGGNTTWNDLDNVNNAGENEGLELILDISGTYSTINVIV